jgi:hypothetical protein
LIIETTCGDTLGVKQGCSVLARYDILDDDPFDKDKVADQGVWYAGLQVYWATHENQLKSSSGVGTSSSATPGAPGATIPEPSTWLSLLVGFSALGFAGYSRANSRQL